MKAVGWTALVIIAIWAVAVVVLIVAALCS